MNKCCMYAAVINRLGSMDQTTAGCSRAESEDAEIRSDSPAASCARRYLW